MVVVLLISAPAFAISFQAFRSNVDPEKNTKVYIKDFWGKTKGKEVRWSGLVVDVRGGGRGKYKVLISMGKSTQKYSVVLITHDKRAATLKKGQAVSFSGFLHDFSWVTPKQIKNFLKSSKWQKEITVVLSDGRLN